MHNPPTRVQQELQAPLQEQLRQDPFLTYKGESDQFYRVQTRGRQTFSIHKNRNVPEPFPYAHSWPLHAPFRWLKLSFLGLLTGGPVTFIFAPVAFISALRVRRDGLCDKDLAKINIILGAAAVLWVIGILLSTLLLLHL